MTYAEVKIYTESLKNDIRAKRTELMNHLSTIQLNNPGNHSADIYSKTASSLRKELSENKKKYQGFKRDNPEYFI